MGGRGHEVLQAGVGVARMGSPFPLSIITNSHSPRHSYHSSAHRALWCPLTALTAMPFTLITLFTHPSLFYHLSAHRALWCPLTALTATPFTRQSFEHGGPTEVELAEATRVVGMLPELLCFDEPGDGGGGGEDGTDPHDVVRGGSAAAAAAAATRKATQATTAAVLKLSPPPGQRHQVGLPLP